MRMRQNMVNATTFKTVKILEKCIDICLYGTQLYDKFESQIDMVLNGT